MIQLYPPFKVTNRFLWSQTYKHQGQFLLGTKVPPCAYCSFSAICTKKRGHGPFFL